MQTAPLIANVAKVEEPLMQTLIADVTAKVEAMCPTEGTAWYELLLQRATKDIEATLEALSKEDLKPSGLPKSRRSASAVAAGIVRTGGATKCQYAPCTRKNTAVADDTF